MFQAYTNTQAIYSQNQPINFNTVKFKDCRISDTGGTNFSICAPGKYVISFNGVGASNTADSAFSIALSQNGTILPETTSAITSIDAESEGTLSFLTIVSILPSCCSVNNTTNLQVVVTSTNAGTLYGGNLVIYRLK